MEVLPNNNRKGLVTSYTGPMFSGKSSRLVTDYRRSRFGRQYSLLFKPSIDVRYAAGKVSTHDSLAEECLVVGNSDELTLVYDRTLEELVHKSEDGELKKSEYGLVFEKNGYLYLLENGRIRIHNVFIDEPQFLDSKIKLFIKKAINLGTNIFMSYLTQTSGGRGFPFADGNGNVTELLEISDFIQTFSAVCYNCGHVATKTYKLQSTGKTTEVGGADLYRAACVDCWQPRE